MRTGRFVTYCLVVFSAVGLLTGGLIGCSDNSSVEQSEDAPLPSVVVTTVKNVSVNPSRSFVGRIEAVEDVQVKARVSGYLLAMDFTEGQSVKEIATHLNLSVKTVEAHKFNLMRKLDIHNKAQLVQYAIQKKIIKIPVGP